MVTSSAYNPCLRKDWVWYVLCQIKSKILNKNISKRYYWICVIYYNTLISSMAGSEQVSDPRTSKKWHQD